MAGWKIVLIVLVAVVALGVGFTAYILKSDIRDVTGDPAFAPLLQSPVRISRPTLLMTLNVGSDFKRPVLIRDTSTITNAKTEPVPTGTPLKITELKLRMLSPSGVTHLVVLGELTMPDTRVVPIAYEWANMSTYEKPNLPLALWQTDDTTPTVWQPPL